MSYTHSNPIKIGTRDSPLAMWQARKVENLLNQMGLVTELVAVKSEGDLDLVTPLYALGVQGVFTKTLDAHLLSGYIDIAVHSMKDVPVQLAQGIQEGAVLERAAIDDVIVWKDQSYSWEELSNINASIGTGSVRRKSFWKSKYPHHSIENLRGNVQTRLKKLAESNWVGAIFAKAGLERMELEHLNMTPIDWMLNAPAQGAIMVVCRSNDEDLFQILQNINHENTALCVREERAFLSTLEGGCSTPIGALATIENGNIYFKGNISDLEGKSIMSIEDSCPISQLGIGQECAHKLLNLGANEIVKNIRNL